MHRMNHSPRCARWLALAVLTLTLEITAPCLASDERLYLPRLDPDPPRTKAMQTALDASDLEKENAVDPHQLWFRNGFSLSPRSGLARDIVSPLEGLFVIQFNGRIMPADRARLVDTGAQIHDYLQHNAFLVEVPPTASAAVLGLLEDGLVRSITRLPAEAKLGRSLDMQAKGSFDVSVAVIDSNGTAEERIRAWIRGPLVRDRRGSSMAIHGRLDGDGLAELVQEDSVIWIAKSSPARPQNIEASMNTAADRVHAANQFLGVGSRVAVNDTGLTRTGSSAQCGGASAAYHPDLAANRIVDEWDFENNDSNACDDRGHGTHVAGTVGGDGTDTLDWKGIAPEASLLIYKDCCDQFGNGFGNFSSVLQRAALNDAAIIGNSWNHPNDLSYNGNSFLADRAVRGDWTGSDGSPNRMFVSVSAGNRAGGIEAPGTAKNIVTVGAVKDGNSPGGVDDLGACFDTFWPAGDRICFSNVGPVDTDGDGNTRIKPDLVAPGTDITSAGAAHLNGNRLYVENNGTSMAQPQVAGAAALLIDAFPHLDGRPEEIKARLLASAVDLGDRNQYGHGMLNTLHSIYSTPSSSWRLSTTGEISSTGESDTFTFNVSPDWEQVRVYLTWSDPPSMTTETVNDLDLYLTDPNGDSAGYSLSYDDTVEFVRIDNPLPIQAPPVAGTWTIEVRGYSVPQPGARYGLAAVEIHAESHLAIDSTTPEMCLEPGESFAVYSSISNFGADLPAVEMQLELPSDPSLFLLSSVDLETSEWQREHRYAASDIRLDTSLNDYSLYMGMINQSILRTADWNMQVGTSTPDGAYTLFVTADSPVSLGAFSEVPVYVESEPPPEMFIVDVDKVGRDIEFRFEDVEGYRYNVYAGSIGDWDSHLPVVDRTVMCGVQPDSSSFGIGVIQFEPPEGDIYFLPTASSPCSEGSAGDDSSGAQRDPSLLICPD